MTFWERLKYRLKYGDFALKMRDAAERQGEADKTALCVRWQETMRDWVMLPSDERPAPPLPTPPGWRIMVYDGHHVRGPVPEPPPHAIENGWSVWKIPD